MGSLWGLGSTLGDQTPLSAPLSLTLCAASICLLNICSPHFLKIFFLYIEVPDPTLFSLVQDGIEFSNARLPMGLLFLWRSCMYVMNFSLLLICYVNVIIRPAKRSRKGRGPALYLLNTRLWVWAQWCVFPTRPCGDSDGLKLEHYCCRWLHLLHELQLGLG